MPKKACPFPVRNLHGLDRLSRSSVRNFEMRFPPIFEENSSQAAERGWEPLR